MASELKSISYGKSRVRVAKLERGAAEHGFTDLTVDIQLDGPFEACYLTGDNSQVVPTDTMKNTVYALAGMAPITPPEQFALRLGRHFLETHAHVRGAKIHMRGATWGRLTPHAFELGVAERMVDVEVTRESATVQAGIDRLTVLKTAGSAFEGFLRDRFTTLRDANDRLLATAVRAVWRYDREAVDFNACYESCRTTLIEAFATHQSKAVQETLYAMGDAVLARHPMITEIEIAMPNKHYLPTDLTPFGVENRNEVFVPTDEPHGLIQAVIRRVER